MTRILDWNTKKIVTIDDPIYCLSPDGKYAFTTDFRRLQDVRPGYGYAGIPDPFAKERAPEKSGIWKLDLQNGQKSLIFSLAQAAQIPFNRKSEAAFQLNSKHWFNHLLCNPDGTRLFFLHRWNTPGRKRAFDTRAFTIAFDGAKPYVLDPHGSTSHFVWRDSNHIFAWAWHPSHGERFYLYQDQSSRVDVIGKNVMIQNGHNTYVPGTRSTWVLNDTYPDRDGYQTPYLFHIPSNRKVEIGQFRSPAEYRGEWRCDTHPCASRDGRFVVFDSPHAGGRQVYLADIAAIIEG
ncbi:hypothetical protein [Tuwongella immobilis]|uniref:hypothetical protein n=1 Tax=Tuwongella immobilis TaxID=692036 RepID=UPI0018D734EE|nr:hypothetical protein [Tuwongella immobilis]